ncbi:MAG: gmhB [Akkermansiaceae bacterium]|nr:gmhB [Akkermansiaceae bacterium]
MRALQRHVHRVRVLCPDNQLSFWTASGFGEGIAYPAKAGAREIAKRLDTVEAVLAWEAGPALEACARAGVAKRYGPAAKPLAKYLTDPISVLFKPGPIRHRVQFYLEIVDALGADAFVPDNFVPVKTASARSETVLLAPDSDQGSHFEWPLERWVEVAQDLQRRGASLTVATNGQVGHALAARLDGVPALAVDLPGLDELSKHLVCITADGTLPHFASHVGTTCVVLFGPGEPEWMRPLGKQHVIVRRKVECSPCFARKCVIGDLRCQNDFPVTEVLRGIDSLS